MLTDQEMQHIAKLARLELSDTTVQHLKKDFSSILAYIDTLNEVNTGAVEPLYQTTGLVNAMRVDDPRGDFTMNDTLNGLLIGQAPNKEGRLVKVKSALSHK